MFIGFLKGIIPAIIGASTVTPLCSIIDIAIVKSAQSGDMLGSIIESVNNFKIDRTSLLNFSVACSPLLSTNFLKGGTKQVLIGTTLCMGLSVIKDTLLLDNDVPLATKLMFVARDGIANSPSLLYPGGTFSKQVLAIMACQVPCTLINSVAIDYCLYSDYNDKYEYLNTSTCNRIFHAFTTSYGVRVSRSVFSIGISTEINHNMKKSFGYNVKFYFDYICIILQIK